MTRVWTPGDHISASATFSWDRCSAAFWFDRVLHVPRHDRSFFILGSELHKIAEWQLMLKRDKQPLLTDAEVAARITSDLELRCSVPDGVKYGKEETQQTLIEDAIAMAGVYMREVLPQIEPMAIETLIDQRDGLRLPGSGTPVKAIIDVIDQNGYIRDLKSGKAKWPEGAAEKKLQTSVYSWAYRIKYGMPPPALIYDLIVRKKRGKKRTTAEAEYHQIKVVPDPALEFGALRRMEAIVSQMKQGQYFPIHSHECDDCSFAEVCRQHFMEQPFAPWLGQMETAPTNGPRYISAGGNGDTRNSDTRPDDASGAVQPQAGVGVGGDDRRGTGSDPQA